MAFISTRAFTISSCAAALGSFSLLFFWFFTVYSELKDLRFPSSPLQAFAAASLEPTALVCCCHGHSTECCLAPDPHIGLWSRLHCLISTYLWIFQISFCCWFVNSVPMVGGGTFYDFSVLKFIETRVEAPPNVLSCRIFRSRGRRYALQLGAGGLAGPCCWHTQVLSFLRVLSGFSVHCWKWGVGVSALILFHPLILSIFISCIFGTVLLGCKSL